MAFWDRWRKGYKYKNTRQYIRIPAAWPIKCEPVEAGWAGGPHITATQDVSGGGVRILLKQMIPAGARIRLEIHVPPLGRSIQAAGQVVRCLPSRRGGFETGIRFDEVQPQDRAALIEAIDKFVTSGQKIRQERSWWRKIS
ncbi:MAG: PilZ domain-containing protein [Candidatus Omnitrophica bacterium]|nr:PilZ domain-containing protein [Candidatus Omnitrophota bacterium]